MSSIAKIGLLFVVLILIGGGLVVWKNKFGGHHSSGQALNRITKEEMELLLKDANPMMLKRLKDDPEMKKQQIDNLKELLALASQAQKDGLGNDAENRKELENIKSELIAVNYDKEINKDKGPMPPFGFITEDQVKAFWEGGANDAAFEQFITTKINLLKANNPEMKDREISEEERNQAKDFYAKIQIYKKEYEDKAAKGELSKELQDKVNLQVKLQQASFLARIYSKKLAENTKVTDEDVAKYIAEHPEFDPAAKKTKADEILARAKGGEDFAKLANEFSQDPGNKDPKSGELQGGIYKDVPKGRMMPEFEAAALALEPGKVADNLVETPYGYHIIKLEKKSDTKDQSGQASQIYDVRHILISTGIKDPENPMGREMPVKDFVRTKLEGEKEKKAMEDILAKNQVEVAEDFVIPEVSEEELQKMMQKQMPPGMSPNGQPGPPPPPAQGDPKKPAAPPAANKPAPKKAN